jgi:hypothetical protein
VAGEGVHVGDDDGLALVDGAAADAAAALDADAGRLALEGAEHQLVALQEVEAGPVQAGHAVEHQRAEVGAVGDAVGLAGDQALQLRPQVVEHGLLGGGAVAAVGGVVGGEGHGGGGGKLVKPLW